MKFRSLNQKSVLFLSICDICICSTSFNKIRPRQVQTKSPWTEMAFRPGPAVSDDDEFKQVEFAIDARSWKPGPNLDLTFRHLTSS